MGRKASRHKIVCLLCFICVLGLATAMSGNVYAGDKDEVPKIKQVAVGMNHTVILKEDGTVWSWGANDFGQLGDGTTKSRSFPAQVKGIEEVIAVAAGNRYTVALKEDGTVWSWGNNFDGQLGDGEQFVDKSQPVQVRGLNQITKIAAGLEHTVALKEDGSVWTWGQNDFKQVGKSYDFPEVTQPMQVEGIKEAIDIAAGGSHTLVLLKDGTVWGFGSNVYCQLASDSVENFEKPIKIKKLNNIVKIAAGIHHTVAVKEDGTVWSWGENRFGELGRGTETRIEWEPMPVQGIEKVIQVAAGECYTAAIKEDGTLWVWGSNIYGQLAGEREFGRNEPRLVNEIKGAIGIAAGTAHSAVLKEDGSVWCFGRNEYYQLGDGTELAVRSKPILVPGMKKVIAVATGGYHTVALKEDGTVWAWGDNEHGQLGDGTDTEIARVPVKVKGLQEIRQIAASDFYTMALKEDGTIWTWGDNSWGQLGDGRIMSINEPIQVQGFESNDFK